MNPLLPGHSGTTPEPTRNTTRNNQGTNEDGSQNDPHPEAGLFHGQTTRNVSLEERHDNCCSILHKNFDAVRGYYFRDLQTSCQLKPKMRVNCWTIVSPVSPFMYS